MCVRGVRVRVREYAIYAVWRWYDDGRVYARRRRFRGNPTKQLDSLSTAAAAFVVYR